MTTDKARKRAVRERMAKTGERYAAARRHVVRQAKLPPRVADPGMSDEAVARATGRDWDGWFRVLDAWGAANRTHREIARYLAAAQGVADWWSQMVTVGYERARGMRAINETLTGFCAYASKTVGVDADRLWAAFTDARRRRRWLEPGTVRVRTSRQGRSATFDFRDGSRVSAWFAAKSPSKTTVSIVHDRLPDADAVREMKAFWKEKLARLNHELTG